jgi:anti-sigma regulatory factor (Ser/Thr protein kinase)/anti-anti-sigma regulatory factor
VDDARSFGEGRLTVQIRENSPFLASQWIGEAVEEELPLAERAARELLARPGERVVLDLGRLARACDGAARLFAETLTEVQRRGGQASLVRCSGDLYRRLRRAGLKGSVAHVASLGAATNGLMGDPVSTVELHLRSAPEMLKRLRSVVSAVTQQAGMPTPQENQVKIAVSEAAANAMVHGSPEGTRNHVRVSFHLEPKALTVDVADQGPGFDPERTRGPQVELPESGYGLQMIHATMDRVEYYRDEYGMVVRMTKFLTAPSGWS